MTDILGVKVEPWEDGCAFSVKAHPGARRDAVAGVHDGMLRIEVAAAPEKGRANQAIARLLAKKLGTPPTGVVLLVGGTASRKRFGVHGLRPEATLRKLTEILG
ncbi:MAG: DUF167 domain-containing protein [Planctomycetota bacterium]|jgi:uncharacterized protein YggU (UPF0235/DUF167 family)|nr:DUF167 domain-containing protein [Planctomycetota bacterium]